MAHKTAVKSREVAPPPPPPAPEASAISTSGAKYQYPTAQAVSISKSNPRQEAAIYENALNELSLVPELAAKAYYAIPRKKKNQKTGEFEEVMVEGLSIRASEALSRRWGNCISGSHVREELDDRIICEGIFIDCETNAWVIKTIAAEKFYVDRKTGHKTPLKPDMLTNAIQSAQAKAMRNAQLGGIPAWLKVAYFDEAKRIVAGGERRITTSSPTTSPEDRLEWLYKHFPALGVSIKMLDAYSDENFQNVSTQDRVVTLVGIYNALKEGQSKVDEIFTTTEKKTAGEGAVKGSDLGGGTQ